MKFLIPLILAVIAILTTAGCAGRKPARVGLRPLSSPGPVPTSLRYPEVVRPYFVGRQVDPDNPVLLHEAHQVYRVEAESRWDLHAPIPCSQPVAVLLNPPMDAAFAPPPLNDAIVAELNHQKQATERVMWEATRLTLTYDNLQKVIQDLTWVAQEYTATKNQLRLAEERLRKLEDLSLEAPKPATP